MLKKIIILFLIQVSYSQNKWVEGYIFSNADSLPLPYVNIYNDNYKFGTITNELGKYVLNYPDSLLNFNITISSLGFLTKTVANQSIQDTIYLEQSTIDLDEVLILNTNNDIHYVLKKVYENIKNNYNNKRHLLKGFYRQTAIKARDSNYLRIIEADVGMQEYGILKGLDRDRIKTYQYRKSDDKITKKWYMNVLGKMFGKQNYLFWIKKKDFVKNFVKNKDYHSHYNNILKNYSFEFSGYNMMNGDLIAVYSYYRNRYNDSNLKDYEKSKLYVNLSNYAIVKIKDVEILGPPQSYTVFAPEEYYYTKIGDYYYLNHAINSRFLSGTGNDKEFEIDELYIYQVLTDRKLYNKIKRKEKEMITEGMYDKKIKYDTLFWNNYKILPEVPLKTKMKGLIQKDKNLEKQFLDNGEN